MTIDDKLISRLEKLAKLDLSNEERQELKADLENILQMVNKLDEVNTEGVDPLIYVLQEHNVWRADRVEGQIERKDTFKNAPDTDGEFFKVPKVIDIK